MKETTLKKLLIAALLAIIPWSLMAQDQRVRVVGDDPTGQTRPVLTTTAGELKVSCATCSGGSGGGGAVTAASGAYALGSIVDIGTGSSPGASTVNGRLSGIAGQLPASLGSKTQANSLPVALSTDGPVGQQTDAAATTTDTTATTLIAQTKQLVVRVNALITALGTPAQAGGAVTGNVASGVTDAGNPVKFGCKYNATPPTFTDGQRADCQSNAAGSTKVALSNLTGSELNSSAPADARANPGTALAVSGFGQVWDGTAWQRTKGDGTGALVGGHGFIATNQASVTTSATLVCAARTGRQKAILTETTAVDFYYGASSVTTTTGAIVKGVAGGGVSLDTAAAIYAVATGAVTITCTELY